MTDHDVTPPDATHPHAVRAELRQPRSAGVRAVAHPSSYVHPHLLRIPSVVLAGRERKFPLRSAGVVVVAMAVHRVPPSFLA